MEAVAYFRTSGHGSATGDDSEGRQRRAVKGYAKAHGVEIVAEFYDAHVSGADPVQSRPGFRAMLERIAGNGVRAILIESPDRFARDLLVGEVGYRYLADQGVELIPTTAPTHYTDETPTSKMIRQILGVIAEFDKDNLIARLQAGKQRARAAGGRWGGPARHVDARPEVVAEAKRLRRRNPHSGKVRSYRTIAVELAKLGYLNANGQPFAGQSIKNMIDGPRPKG